MGGKIQLAASWKPTALIAVINRRTDISDMDKIKLAARAKMEGNLGDLLPKKYGAGGRMADKGRNSDAGLKFKSDDANAVSEDVDPSQKWKTVVFSALPEEKKGRDKTSSTKDNVNSLKKKFETSSMKDNEAYVIM